MVSGITQRDLFEHRLAFVDCSSAIFKLFMRNKNQRPPLFTTDTAALFTKNTKSRTISGSLIKTTYVCITFVAQHPSDTHYIYICKSVDNYGDLKLNCQVSLSEKWCNFINLDNRSLLHSASK